VYAHAPRVLDPPTDLRRSLVIAIDRRPLVRAGLARLAATALAGPARAVADLAEATAVLCAAEAPLRAVVVGVSEGQNAATLVAQARELGAPVLCAIDDPSDGAGDADAQIALDDLDEDRLRSSLATIEAGGRPSGDGGYRGSRRSGPLTERSLEVLRLLAEGLHDHEIALRLGISTSSVRKHIAGAQSRLGARTRTQAVATAARGGLL
jgi:DNA-binding NarL/FixJ family response regulator